MTDVWSDRAEGYRTSESHASGDDLETLVPGASPVRVGPPWTLRPAAATSRGGSARRAAPSSRAIRPPA
jgi:hypothetical protein